MPLLLVQARLLDRWRYGLRICAGLYGGFRGVALIAFSFAGPELWTFYAAAVLDGIGEACGPTAPLVVVALAPPERAAEFFGLVNMLQEAATCASLTRCC